MALSTCPVSRLTSFTPQLFRVILLRRLHLPLPLTVRNCQCGLPLDSRGHHRAACARAGVLGGRGTLSRMLQRETCREARGRVTTNVVVSYLVLVEPHVNDARGLEVVADGLPLFGEGLSSKSTQHWSVPCGPTEKGCAAGWRGRRSSSPTKGETLPLVGRHHRAHLVVVALLAKRDASIHHPVGEG